MRMLRSNPKSKQAPAVVIGLDCMTGLQTARILARRGVPVIGVAKNPSHPCSHTNVCEKIIFADTGGDGLMDELQKLGPELARKGVLIPCTDASVLQISRHRRDLSAWYHIALPQPEVVEMMTDKIRFYSYARANAMPVPTTLLLRDKADLQQALREISFPCVLKPPLKTPLWEGHTKAKAFKIDDPSQLISIYERCAAWSDMLLLQQWIEGRDSNLYSCNCYFNAGSEALVTFVSRKVRQWPLDSGTSCFGQEWRNDVLLQQTQELFQKVGLFGLGYLEMKLDEDTGKHFIVEPNIGRPTGRSALAEAAGVELLYTM
jgi:D-aspartate ligase